MSLAASAPWPSLPGVLLATSLLLVPVSKALVVRSRPQSFSLLSIEQVPGPIPQYISYGAPQFTTFSNLTTACKACLEFFPEKQDGERFHSVFYADDNGGVWPRICRAGPCDFRDPQTDPVGGVIGKGVGPGGTPDGKSCITRDPVPWYSDCDPVVKAAVTSTLDATHYCSYREQIFIPPPAKMVSYFAGGKGNAWKRIGGSQEQCFQTIETQGSNLMDTMTHCDSDLRALSGCCETVFNALNCVAETSAAKGGWNMFASMNEEGTKMLETFSKYCVPLCSNTKEAFCEKYPNADICVTYSSCSDCTAAGGLWCPKLESCHCPGPKPPCIKPPVLTPLQCLPKIEAEEEEATATGVPKNKTKKSGGQKAKEAATGEASEEALCKYSKFAEKWLPDDEERKE